MCDGRGIYQDKKLIIGLLDRLVDCPLLKRSLFALYSTLLPRGGHPWIYLTLNLVPEKVDVNVHPTKKEVHFLDEEEIVEAICTQVQDLLADANTSRNFKMTQAILSGVTNKPSSQLIHSSSTHGTARPPSSSRPVNPQHLVRMDDKIRRLDAMSGFEIGQSQVKTTIATQSKIRGEDEGWTMTPDITISDTIPQTKAQESKTNLQSIFELREQVKKKRHYKLTSVLEAYNLVGVVDTRKSLALIQHGTKLFLIQYATLIQEAAYQSALRQFGALLPMQLLPAPSLEDLIQSALLLEASSHHDRFARTGLSDDEIVKRVCNRLLTHASMLLEYFSMEIDPVNKTISSLPNLLSNRVLFNLERLPTMLLRLATQIDWTQEKECFHGIMQELAFAHVPSPALHESEEAATKEKVEKDWLAGWIHEIRYMVPSTLLAQDIITEVANLPSLYSVFERC